jgi:hypothetical protein
LARKGLGAYGRGNQGGRFYQLQIYGGGAEPAARADLSPRQALVYYDRYQAAGAYNLTLSMLATPPQPVGVVKARYQPSDNS